MGYREEHQIPTMVCQVCRRPIEELVTYDDDDTRRVVEFCHSRLIPGVERHDAVPVLLEDYLDQVSICDICGQPSPIWEYPVVDFEVFIGFGPGGTTQSYHSIENWYVCDQCKTDVTADRWSDISVRWLEYHPDLASHSPRERRAMRKFVERMRDGFRANRQGEPWLIGTRPTRLS